MRRIASIALSEGLRSYDKLYDYLVTREHEVVVPGMRVLVPFGAGNKLQAGWVISTREEASERKLKAIQETFDAYPLLNEDLIKLAEWMRNRYFCTWGDAIRNMVPSGVHLSKQKTVRFLRIDETLPPRVTECFERLKKNSEGISLQDLTKELGEDDVRDLIKKGCIELDETFAQRVSEKMQRAVYPAIDQNDFDELVESGKIKSIYQIRAMELLLVEGLCTLQDLMLIPGVNHQTIRALHKKGLVEYTEIETERNPFEYSDRDNTPPPELTSEQSNVLAEIIPRLSEEGLKEALLHGITGSGKTEVYLRLIDAVIKLGKSAIVLVPEISLTPQMTSRFTGRFGERVAILHSRLSLGERYDQWRKVRQGEVDVVIGARSAVFAPLSDIGLIIVDEEHELTYKSETTPKYDARQVARARCNIHSAMLLLGSATPSVETYYRAKTGKITLCEMFTRANAKPLPEVLTVDMRRELEEGNRSIISRTLEEELTKNKKNGEQSILFLNRRGYATFLLCGDCGYTLKCPHCSVSLTYHVKDNQSICHYCGYTLPAPKTCPNCGSLHFKSFGTGTQRIEEELSRHPEGFRVIRMDLDTTGTKDGHKNVLDAFRRGDADILIGTQMVAKGHDFPNVTLVGILAADASLFTGDHRSSERTFQLITQASGRAGRGEKPGRVVLQAYNIEDYAVETAICQDYQAFYTREIAIRQQLGNPPFSHIGLVMVSAGDGNDSLRAIEKLYQYIFKTYGTDAGIVITKPMKAPIYILRNKARWRLIIKHLSVNRLVQILRDVLNVTERLKIRDAQVGVDINPASML